jgi:hypothetical protein
MRPSIVQTCVLLLTALAGAQQSDLATIEGSTLDANGQALAGTSVWLRVEPPANQPPQAPWREARSDAAGKFSFQGLDAGRYRLSVEHIGYAGLHVPETLTVIPGEHMTGLTLALVAVPLLSGRVTDENGDPMAGVTVRPMTVIREVNGRPRIGSSGNTGRDVLTDAKGEYRLLADPELSSRWYLSFTVSAGHVYATTYYPGVGDLALASGIDTAGRQEISGLDVRLQKTPLYHARGKVASPFPAGLQVIAFQEQGDALVLEVERGQPVEADGRFDIAGLTPGDWTLLLRESNKAAGLGSRAVRVGDGDVDDVAIDIEPPVDVNVTVKTIAEPPRSFPPMHVRLVPTGVRQPSAPVGVAVDGSSTLKSVEANLYRVDVRDPPPGGFVQSVTLDGRESIDTGIDLRGGRGSLKLQIVVSLTAGQITGAVTNADGGVAAAVVTLMPDGPPAPLYRPELHRYVKTDAGGQFAIGNLAPGTYRVYAWERLPWEARPGDPSDYANPEFLKMFDSLSVEVKIGASESKQVTLNLIPAARVDEGIRRLR